MTVGFPSTDSEGRFRVRGIILGAPASIEFHRAGKQAWISGRHEPAALRKMNLRSGQSRHAGIVTATDPRRTPAKAPPE